MQEPKINPTEIMQFLTIVRFETIEEVLGKIFPDFATDFTAAYMKKVAQNADKFPQMKELADAILTAHEQEKKKNEN